MRWVSKNYPVDDQNTYAMFASSLLHTASGQINLVAIGSSGEMFLDNDLTMTGILLESESNQEDHHDKFNRVDLLVIGMPKVVSRWWVPYSPHVC